MGKMIVLTVTKTGSRHAAEMDRDDDSFSWKSGRNFPPKIMILGRGRANQLYAA